MLSSIALSTLLVVASNAAPASHVSCKSGFLNTVFNTGSAKHASWPDPVWSTLTSYGIQNFITFSLIPLNQNPLFDTATNVPARYNRVLEAARIPIVMDPRDTKAAQAILSSNKTPAYLELFSEPDYSYGGATPLTDPIPAAKDLSKLVGMPHSKTKFISPALANPNNASWLPVFFDNCKACKDQIDIVAMHLYEPDVDKALGSITQFHNTWPDKRIWITEFGPYNGGGSGCTFDQAGVANYAKTIIPKIDALGYVDKIFWNCGDAEPADVCNPSLTNEDGSANDVLKAYGGACGFSGS